MLTVSRRNLRRFQPRVDGLDLRIAPTIFAPAPPPPEVITTTTPTSDDAPPPPPPTTVLDPMPPCSTD